MIGHQQNFDSEIIGSGKMILTEIVQNKKIKCDLEFFKPWKSKSISEFNLIDLGNRTEVEWTMNSTAPFFVILFKKILLSILGQDFNRGLVMLKSYVETGRVLSDTQIQNVISNKSFYTVGFKHKSQLTDIGQLMTADFNQLNLLVQDGALPMPKLAAGVYHKFDMIKNNTEFTSAFVYDADVAVPTDKNLIKKLVKDHSGFSVLHTGSYDHMGNGWSAAMGHVKHKKLKLNKSVDMYELYLNNPSNSEIKNLKTQIVIPVK